METSLTGFIEIMDALNQFDTDKKDTVLTSKEFNQLENKTHITKTLTGKDNISEWTDFKNEMKDYLKNWGFEWTALKGPGAALKLTTIFLDEKIGYDLAKTIFQNIDNGKFTEKLKLKIPSLFSFINNDDSKIEYTAAKTGFANFCENNKSYKFKKGRGGNEFIKSKREFVYGSEDKIQDEIELGDLIKDKLAVAINNITLGHTQTERKDSKYMNADFLGYEILDDITYDKIELYAFELKPSNKIPSISEAILQAVNYKTFAHYTYIIIPLFTEDLFYNPQRFNDFRELCLSNGVGIVSINFDDAGKTFEVVEVMPAERGEIKDKARITSFIEENGLEVCPLCNRIVDTETRKKCKWQVGDKEDVKCMKILLEDQVINNITRD